ncbi:MAG: cellulase family glycosylhydrolase [Oscillospiraceae bacterium]|nr:cellulase family glycosylhydrolase [Oscillospiraceae bacterium]
MNKFVKRSAALALTAVLLATGCSGKKPLSGESSELSEDVSSEVSEDSGSAADSSEVPGGADGDESVSGTGANGGADSSDGNNGADSGSEDGSSSEDNSDSSGSSDGTSSSSSSSPNTSSSTSTSSSKPVSSSTSASSSKPASSSTPTSSSKPTSSSTNPIQTANKPSGGSVTSGFAADWKADNSWEESGNKCGSVELNITNNSGKNISSWTITFTVPSGFKVTNGWSGTYKVDGTTLTVTNAEYNGSVPAGGSINIGFNYSAPSVFTPPSSISINGIEGSSSNNNNGNNNNNNNNQNNGDKNPVDPVPSEDILKLIERSDKAVQGDDWLHTDGNRILDKNGKQVWLTGVNWFGYNTGTNTFDGLWNSQMRGTVKAIADHGFNLIRVPISAELLNQWSRGEYPKANYNNASNPEMNDMNSLQIFDYFLKLAEENGMKVMPDIHCAETNAMGHNVNLWYTDKVTVNDYYHALEWLADRYKDNDTIIAIDIKNEPHGKPNEGSNAAIWNNSKAANNWKYVAEQAAAKILAKNPNVLIMVEGTEIYSKKNGSYTSTNSADYYFNWWGGNLRGVRDYPVNLGKYQDKLVYSPHDYGPTVYEQPWFKGGFDYNSLIRDCWQDNWLYIQKENIAPLLIGEWGGFMKEPNLKWMTCMRKLIKEYHLNHTFWCYNANSGDTGGLVLDDFTTWDTEKYNFVKEVLWQENGKFVGLDHAIPLGANGITLTSAKGL